MAQHNVTWCSNNNTHNHTSLSAMSCLHDPFAAASDEEGSQSGESGEAPKPKLEPKLRHAPTAPHATAVGRCRCG